MKNDHVFVALLHYPAMDREGKIIVTSFTTMDLHDIARPARAYEVGGFYIVQPVDGQRIVIQRQISYWLSEEGRRANPTRYEIVRLVRLKYTLDEVVEELKRERGRRPVLVGTDARKYPNSVSYAELRDRIERREEDFLLLFGTGYGIPPDMMRTFDLILEPVYGAADWNHLSVRNAAAIILDRLLSRNRC
ncbi:MAG TPA: RNA methyltransferase [Aquifex aeolicus]|uniref:RNA methyltransferase n=1 Tax=Aquifex aeolicus TaxID=63363 RepID=A0A7C5Q9H5_AQUAO|nr:RNA methyltransferase [Aquifex aeolicus]